VTVVQIDQRLSANTPTATTESFVESDIRRVITMENALEERKRIYWSHDYRVTYERGEKFVKNWRVSRINPHYYSITLVPKEHLVHGQGIWYDIDKRDRYTHDIWDYFIHQVNRYIDNNYRRHKHLQIHHLIAIEHYDKKDKNRKEDDEKEEKEKFLIKPHVHGTLAVPCECNERFRSLLVETDKGVYTINFSLLKGDFSAIYSVKIKEIYDINYWFGYSMKEQFSGKHYEDMSVERRTK
jgi:hypothetical protein